LNSLQEGRKARSSSKEIITGSKIKEEIKRRNNISVLGGSGGNIDRLIFRAVARRESDAVSGVSERQIPRGTGRDKNQSRIRGKTGLEGEKG